MRLASANSSEGRDQIFSALPLNVRSTPVCLISPANTIENTNSTGRRMRSEETLARECTCTGARDSATRRGASEALPHSGGPCREAESRRSLQDVPETMGRSPDATAPASGAIETLAYADPSVAWASRSGPTAANFNVLDLIEPELGAST